MQCHTIVILCALLPNMHINTNLYRGAGGYWRTYQAQQLATPESFKADPSLVWEFYSYRREVMHSKVLSHLVVHFCEPHPFLD